MGKSFIKGLTSFIDTNRQEIRTTLKYSTVLTAGFIAIFAFHPFLMSCYAMVMDAIKPPQAMMSEAFHSLLNQVMVAVSWSSEKILEGMGFVAVSAYQCYLLFIKWLDQAGLFFSLSFFEMANQTINNMGYALGICILFMTCSTMVYIIRKVIKDTTRLYKEESYRFDDMPIISQTILAVIVITAAPLMLILTFAAIVFSNREDDYKGLEEVDKFMKP